MRHQKAGLKLGRTASHRSALFRNMVTSLFKHEQIRTTGVKAKELRRWADHMITLAKRGDLHARRQALAVMRDKDVVHKLFAEATERFGALNGGYTRIVKLGRRPGDAAPIALIALVDSQETKKKKTKKKKTKAEGKSKKASPAEKLTAEGKTQKAPLKESAAAKAKPKPTTAGETATDATEDKTAE
jgi:large subunit ribosomal protein L17